MRLFFFNLGNVIPQVREVHTVIPAVIFSQDKVPYSSKTGTISNLMEGDFLERNPKQTISFYKNFYALSMGEEQVNDIADKLTTGFKTVNKQMKTKADFQFIAATKKMYKVILKLVFDYLKWSLESYHLEKINPYVKAGDITLTSIFRSVTNEDETNERITEVFLHVLTDEHDYIICTEHIYAQSEIAGMNDETMPADFFKRGILKSDMFSLPGCVMLKRSRLKLLREELQPEFKQWQQTIDTLQQEMKDISFDAENISVLRDKLNASFLPFANALKKRIEESIYFQQVANNEFGEYSGTLSLGITSRGHFLETLKATEQISNEVFEELTGYFSNNNLLDKTVLFFIHSVTSYPEQNKNIKHEEIEQLWDASFQ